MYCCDHIQVSDIVKYTLSEGDFHFRLYREDGSREVREKSEADL
jgi:hypothetical protein